MAHGGSDGGTDLSSVRDTVESIWVAIVLAFVLRAFMIEAFVIPTGSMAPRLMGEHWELSCACCGYEYAYGAPSIRSERAPRSDGNVPVAARCPNCGYPYEEVRGAPSSGDRVLVLKYLYRFAEPQPWDVVVFKNPQNNHENYIKRLVGLPGETIEIVHGDIFVAPSPDGPWSVRTKPKRAQDAMWQVVYDNDYQPDRKRLLDEKIRVNPRGWQALPGADAWDLQGGFGRQFQFRGAERFQEISFGVERHPYKSNDENERALRAVFLPTYGYNSPGNEEFMRDKTDICSDLKLSFTLMHQSPGTVVSLTLSSFDHNFKAELHADGNALLYYCRTEAEPADHQWQALPQVGRIAPLQPGRGYEVALTHVDFTVTLWLDDEPIMSIRPEGYPESHNSLKERIRETNARPAPVPRVKIGARGGPCELRHVKLMRDVYYTEQRLDATSGQDRSTGRYREEDPRYEYTRTRAVQALFKIDPNRIEHQVPAWGVMDYGITLRKHEDNRDLDEFFVLGDNSPQSLDGRAWTAAAPSLRLWDHATGEPLYQPGTVPRYNLLGRALFVYWPAGYAPPGLPGLPIIPNVGRMRLIR